MVDREARDKLAELLRQFASGRVTNHEFEEQWYFPTRSRDKGIAEVEHAIWCLYDDLREHRLTDDERMTPELRRQIATWILFLKTDLEYEWPPLSPSIWCLLAIVLVPLTALVALLQPYAVAMYGAMVFLAYIASSGLISLVSPRLASLMWWPVISVISWFDDRRARRCYGDAYSNIDLWPFYRQSDFAEALSKPRLLCGKSA